MALSVPYLWMTEYTTNPSQCYINVSKNDLAYVFSFNLLLVILPTIGLTILYLMIIVKLKRRDISLGKILNSSHFDGKLTENTSENIQLILSAKKDIDNDQVFKRKPLSSRSSCSSSQNCGRMKIEPKTRSTIAISIVSVIFYCFQLPARLILCWLCLNGPMETNYENNNTQSLNDSDLFEFLLHVVILIFIYFFIYLIIFILT